MSEERARMTPAERIVEALNTFTIQLRSRCSMWLGIGFEFIDIDRSVLTVRVRTRRAARPEALAVEVRNIVLMELQDLVPCAALRILSDDPALERTVEFVRPEDLGRQLPSSMVIIEEAVAPRRAGIRPQVRAWFEELPGSSAPARAEPIPQDEPRYERIDDLIARARGKGSADRNGGSED